MPIDQYNEIRKKAIIDNMNNIGSPENVDLTEQRHAAYNAQQMGSAIGDIATAAVPTLMGIFGSGNDVERGNRINQANSYLQKRAIQDTPNKNSITQISNEYGSPELIDIKNSIGEEPYIKEKLSNSGLVKGVPHKMFNKITGERAIISVGSDNIARKIGEKDPIDMNGWMQDLGVGNATGTDVFGTKTQKQFEKGKVEDTKVVNSTQGLGSYMGGIPLEEAKSRMKEAGKGKEKVAESNAVIGELDASERKLRVTKDPMTFSIALGQALRSVEKRLSEDEQRRFMGNDYRSVFQNAENYIQGKMGEIPPNIRSGVIEAIKYLKEKEQGKAKANQKSYSDKAGLNKKGQETIQRTIGQGDSPKESTDWKSKYK
jgi:hypothetical protein